PPPPPAAPANTLQAIATGPAEVLLGESALLNGCDTLFNGQSLAAAFGGACEAGTLTGFTAEWFFNGQLLGSGFLFSMATGPGTPFDVPGLYEITLLVTFFGDGTTPILTSVTTILIRVVAQAPVPEPGQLLILLAGLLGVLLWWRRQR
ncbi:MAG: PEP-CTERM sorting domain-containing protein, partial [Alphaproteobacteria bacterium]